MCLVVRITFIGLLFLRFGKSLKVSATSDTNYTEVTTLGSVYIGKGFFQLFDKERKVLNILYLRMEPYNDGTSVLNLYNALTKFVHSGHEDSSKVEDYNFAVLGFYNRTVRFVFLVAEHQKTILYERILKEFAKQDSIVNKPYNYTISPLIDVTLLLIPVERPENITFQDYQYYLKIDFNFFILFSLKIILVCVLFTILGSLLICVSIFKYKYLQTPPNVYVFSLAVADTLTLIITLQDVVSTLLGYEVNHKETVYQHLLTGAIRICAKVAIWTAVGIAIDRYIAICHPFLGRRVSTFSRAVKINVTIWALPLIYTLLEFLFVRLFYDSYEIYDMDTVNASFHIILKVVIPMCIILPAYICIVLSIWKSSKVRQSCSTSEQPMTEKSIKIAAVISLQFIFCWAPSEVQLYIERTVNPHNKFIILMVESHLIFWLKLLGITLHPVLYAILSKNFRKAFKDIGCICIGYMRRMLCCGKAAANVDQGIAMN